jgi:hypothetical protein
VGGQSGVGNGSQMMKAGEGMAQQEGVGKGKDAAAVAEQGRCCPGVQQAAGNGQRRDR